MSWKVNFPFFSFEENNFNKNLNKRETKIKMRNFS